MQLTVQRIQVLQKAAIRLSTFVQEIMSEAPAHLLPQEKVESINSARVSSEMLLKFFESLGSLKVTVPSE